MNFLYLQVYVSKVYLLFDLKLYIARKLKLKA